MMKKTMFLMKPFLVMAIILVISFTSCKKAWWNIGEGNGHCGNTIDSSSVLMKGTMVVQSCGKSIYGNNLWIQAGDGQLYQPCAQSYISISDIPLKEGDNVTFKYHKYTGNISGFEFYCKMAYFYFTRATIDFIQVTNQSSGCTLVTSSSNYSQLNAAGLNILNAQIVNGNLELKVGFSGCDDNTKRFKLIAKELPVAGPIPAFEVKLIEDVTQLCQAYFTKDICFDVASLKNPISSGIITINLIGFNQTLQY